MVLGTHAVGDEGAAAFPLETETTDPASGNGLDAEYYPLIGINQAHFVGLHTSSYSAEGLAPQIYFEWNIINELGDFEKLDVPILELALNIFIQRHLVFRSILGDNGQMRCIAVPSYHVETCSDPLSVTRDRMTSGNLNPHVWPLFEFILTDTTPSSSILHVRISLFLLEAISDLIFRQELSSMYRAGRQSVGSMCERTAAMNSALPKISTVQFDRYSRHLSKNLYSSEQYKHSLQFWLSRLDTLASGPKFPVIPIGDKPNGEFLNQSIWLPADEWSALKSNCTFYGVTIPVVLLTVYALSIARWCGQSRFLVNVLVCLRHQGVFFNM